MVFGPKSFFPDDGRSSFLSGVADTPEMAVKDTRAVKMDVKSIVMSMCLGCGARYEISWGLPYRFIVSQRLRFRLRPRYPVHSIGNSSTDNGSSWLCFVRGPGGRRMHRDSSLPACHRGIWCQRPIMWSVPTGGILPTVVRNTLTQNRSLDRLAKMCKIMWLAQGEPLLAV